MWGRSALGVVQLCVVLAALAAVRRTPAMIRYLVHDERVTCDELYATGAAFTVVAWGFAYVYAASQVVWAGSFVGSGPPGDRTWFELLFLSFSALVVARLVGLTVLGRRPEA